MAPFDPYHIWLEISPDQQPPTPHRLLGIAPDETDKETIREAALQRNAFIRQFSLGKQGKIAERLLNEIAAARDNILAGNVQTAVETPSPVETPIEPVVEKTDPSTATPVSPILVADREPLAQQETQSIAAEWSTFQPTKKPRREVPKEIWKRPVVIGVSLVGVIGAFVLVISLMFSGDADPAANFALIPSTEQPINSITEENYELPPPDNIDPNNPLAMEKVEQDREIAEELQQDFDTNNPNLPDIDSVKRRINEATGTNKTILARDPRLRKQIVSREGGTSATEAAVARGLAWLAKHQSPNGNWSLHTFNDVPECTCENSGQVVTDMGATSLALLPFLGAGQTHIVGKYKDHVLEGINYLLDNQIRDGDLSFGSRGNTRLYTHGQGTIVLCEALMMTGDRRLRNPAQEAVNFIVKSQHTAGGWRYNPGQSGDTSVVGWQVMALQSAHAAGLIVPSQTLKKARQYLNQAQTSNSLYGYQPGGSSTYVMTAEALLCRFYLGYNQKSPGVEYGINYLVKNHMPSKPPFNLYYMYYGTQLMHHYGGQPWKTWNAQMQDLLIASQKTNGHRAGSWTPVESHDRAGGRLYTTAMAICCLEVYYRHLPIFRELELE
jgi:hypothetical protein